MKSIIDWIKASAIAITVVVVGFLALLTVVYVMRLFLNATAPITVHEVEPGIKCAISSGGEAIDCWKMEDKHEAL